MRFTTIGYTFVGVWKTPMPNLPALDRQFVLDLFGDPYNTIQQLTPEGLMITKPGHPGTASPNAVFNNLKFQVGGPSISEIKATVEKLRIFFQKTGINLSFAQYGLNVEMEVTDIEAEDAPSWMGEHLLKASLDVSRLRNVTVGNITFELRYQDNQSYVVTIQPRVTNEKSLYFAVNDHINAAFDVSSSTNFEELFSTTEKKIQQQLFTTLKL